MFFVDQRHLQYYISLRFRDQNKESFWKLDDERLKWLESDFIKYFDNWKDSTKVGKKGSRDINCSIPKSTTTPYLTYTDQALRLTTKSTVSCIRYDDSFLTFQF